MKRLNALFAVILLFLLFGFTGTLKTAKAAEGPLESLNCLARAVYWESRGETLDTKIQVAEYLIDIGKSGRSGIHGVCDAVRQVSQGYQAHIKDVPTGPAWDESQEASLMAWQNPSLDTSKGSGAYFIDIQKFVRPGYMPVFVTQIDHMVFFKESPDPNYKPPQQAKASH